MRIFQEFVKAELKAQGTTQEAIARAIGVGAPTFSQKLAKDRPMTVQEFHDLAAELHIGMDELYRIYQH